MVRAGISILALTSVLAGSLVWVHGATENRINTNRAAAQWTAARTLTGVVDLAGEWVDGQLRVDATRTLHRVEVNGYAGTIELLIVTRQGRVDRLVATQHRETPGIGDFISNADDVWMRGFAAQSLVDIDTVTGATITSQAVIRAVQGIAP